VSMTRTEAVEDLEALAGRLESDLRLARTRDEHVRVAQRLAEVRDLAARLRAA